MSSSVHCSNQSAVCAARSISNRIENGSLDRLNS
ncbi:hypothetical protein MAV3388_01750 [Mycobacterium avium subsp. hominissuis 3388]|nr:hypothetical protein MAV3388_01750 [Mycobacterium avium subsp. hominissuis 3388]